MKRYVSRSHGLPVAAVYFTDVTFEPNNDPTYIDRQVRDITVELHEDNNMKPFTEGEPIGACQTVATLALQFITEDDSIYGIPATDFDRMSARVWADHQKKSKAHRRKSYTTRRKAAGAQFLWTWDPLSKFFHVERA